MRVGTFNVETFYKLQMQIHTLFEVYSVFPSSENKSIFNHEDLKNNKWAVGKAQRACKV